MRKQNLNFNKGNTSPCKLLIPQYLQIFNTAALLSVLWVSCIMKVVENDVYGKHFLNFCCAPGSLIRYII